MYIAVNSLLYTSEEMSAFCCTLNVEALSSLIDIPAYFMEIGEN